MTKPDFNTRHGGLLNRRYLPDRLRCALKVLLADGGLTSEQAERFLDSCNELAQMVLGGRQQSFGVERDQLSKVSKAARDLLEALRGLDVDARESLEVHGGQETRLFHRDREFLSGTWDAVDRLASLCDAASAELPRERSDPAAMVGYGLTVHIVESFWRHFDRLPPADQNGWFVIFMQELGKELHLVCGPRPVRKAITEHPHYTSGGKAPTA